MNNLNNKKSIQEEIRAVKKQTVKVLGFGFLVILFFLIYWIYFEESLLVESKSPYADKEVIINKVGNWIIDSGTIKVYFKQDGKTRKIKKIDLDILWESNTKERYNVTWKDEENKVSIGIFFEQSVQFVEFDYYNNHVEIRNAEESN
ncbi:hypothetical protein ACH0B6_09625 [Solibacillus silvestris]